jgi:hypothetical protein
MSKSKTHAIVGTGTAPTKVITEGLRDGLSKGDTVALVWKGKPSDTEEAIYDYVLENEFAFTMYYEEGTNPPRVFRESDHGVTQKVRNATKAAIKDATGTVLFLWDNESDDDQIDPVFDFKADGVMILELTNGLSPITDGDIPEPVEPEVEKDEKEPEDDSRFTKEELETATAYTVKRYGERLGCKATTKSGIIAELFPEDDGADEEMMAAQDFDAAEKNYTTAEDAIEQVLHASDERYVALERSLSYIVPSGAAQADIELLRESAKAFARDVALLTKDSRERSLAFTHIEDSLMWAIKAVCLQDTE